MIIDEETLASINGRYVCPPDAGPGWHEAIAYGIDMSLIELSLELTPTQRLEEHQRVLNFILDLQKSEKRHPTG